jgi:hypothetical protein
MAADLLPLSEENAPAGTPLRPYTAVFDRAAVSAVLDRTGETPEDYTIDGEPRVPPVILLGCYARLIHESFFYETGVHVSSALTLHRLPRLGETLNVTGAILGHSERGGSKYVRFSVNVAGEDGAPAAAIEHVSVYSLLPRASRG